jgi:putative hydrolase of the HAD superfamily
MKYQAVIFDLFGTLVPNFSAREYRAVIQRMAVVLAAPEEEFWLAWKAAFNQRVLGIPPDLESQIAAVCRQLGRVVDQDRVRQAARIRSAYEKETIAPRPDAVPTLTALRSRGLKLGLISDCSSEVPAIWAATPLAPFFTTPVFSCVAGLRKPDPRIYRLALQQLAVEAEYCLYIGDGSSRELPGAAQVGLQPVQLQIPGEDNPDVYRVDSEEWHGRTVASLTEVLDLVEA